MSLTKLLMAPIKLFKKEVITFLIIRRHDLGSVTNDTLRYIAVRPSASISVLRHKVWHLLELPDYCEEIIILKSPGGVEMPLTELRRGNDPQKPYILEVWLPGNRDSINPLGNMITYNNNDSNSTNHSNWLAASIMEENKECSDKCQTTISTETVALNKLKAQTNLIYTETKKSDLSCKMSRSSLFGSGRKSQHNFTNLLLKIQSDLSTLSTKLSALENKVTP